MVLQLSNNVKDVQITTGSIKNSLDAAAILDKLDDSIETTLAARAEIDHDVVTERPDQFKVSERVVIYAPEKGPELGPIGGGDNLDLSEYAKDLDGAGDLRFNNEGESKSGGSKSIVDGFFTFIKVLLFILLIVVIFLAFKNRDALKEKFFPKK